MKIIAGDWLQDSSVVLTRGVLTLRRHAGKDAGFVERTLGKEEMISLSEIKSAMIVDNDKHWALGRNAGWGLAGAVTLGPLGLLAGTLLTGNVKEQVVAVGFKDGRKAVISGKKNKLAPIVASGFVAY